MSKPTDTVWFRRRGWKWHRGRGRDNALAQYGVLYADCAIGLVAWQSEYPVQTRKRKPPDADCCKKCLRIHRKRGEP